MPVLRVFAGRIVSVGEPSTIRTISLLSSRGISQTTTTNIPQHRPYHVSTSSLSPVQSTLLGYRYHQQQHYNPRDHPTNNGPLLTNSSGFHSPKVAAAATTNIHKRWHGGPHIDHDHADSVHVSFVDTEGNAVKDHVDAYVGESLLQVAQRNGIDLEGACEGVCACSTCHVIIPDEDTFDNLLEEASEDEEDMLDMAFGLTETSRLGCQIIVTDEMEGLKIEIPPATRNFYVDGHVPQPH